MTAGALYGELGDVNAYQANFLPRGGLRSPVEFHGKRSCFYLSVLRRLSTFFRRSYCCHRAAQAEENRRQDGSDPRPVGTAPGAGAGLLPSCSRFLVPLLPWSQKVCKWLKRLRLNGTGTGTSSGTVAGTPISGKSRFTRLK
jgi:hypothetical protein